MIKYENSGTFVNKVDYPFNITRSDGAFVDDFWSVLDGLIAEINNEELNKVRYIWIDAGNYCQTEIFLKNLLLKKHEEYPVLYLHWIDFANQDRSVYHQLSQEQINGEYFIDKPNHLKICVIDHAETIGQREQYLELCKRLRATRNKCIFIFVSKKDMPALSYWKEIVGEASRATDDCYLGITRSEKNYFVVKPYTHLQCSETFRKAISNNAVMKKSVSLVGTLGEELRRPYYFDFLIRELNSYRDVSQIPAKLDDSGLILKIFGSSLDGIIAHLRGFITLQEFLDGYYDSHFVNQYRYGDQSRVPFDNYVWAYGIIYCSLKSSLFYDEVFLTQFTYTNNRHKLDFGGQIEEINRRIIELVNSEAITAINSDFVLQDYFSQMAKYSLVGAQICASVLCDCFDQIESNAQKIIFSALGSRHGKALGSEVEIRSHCLLGIEIGKLLPRMENDCIADGLKHLFQCVCDDYVEPKTNSYGISVIPVTNFEFEKFVRDKGYTTHYRFVADKPLNETAVAYYKEIFNFIISALSGNSRKDSKCLARLLKGYDWDQYKQTAYLLSRKDDINNEDIYKSISIYYPDEISYPAKWKNCANTDVSRPFCNPLQPVVCVNIFEARAYTSWLESKIGRSVRLMNYDPDYLSVIGSAEPDVSEHLRQSFLQYVGGQRSYFNSVENDVLFYGSDDIEVKETSPVAIPNSEYLGLYDFVGNIFEAQDTPFTYNYGKNNDEIKRELEKLWEALIDYNCPGGGLQRTEANWPPEYMGQVPAFLRNQDIGFRIFIGSSSIGPQEHKGQIIGRTCYANGIREIYETENQNGAARILDNIHLRYDESKKRFDDNYSRSMVYSNGVRHVIVFTYKNTGADNYKEAILLMLKGEEIFAFHLTGIASIKSDGAQNGTRPLTMIIHNPIVPGDLATRKKSQNQSCAGWIDIVEIAHADSIDTYSAYPLNVTNGHFQITDRNVRDSIMDGTEKKRPSAVVDSYQMEFKPSAQSYRCDYYNSLRKKINADFFLPDWIDIVDFIGNIAADISKTNVLDIETVMAAITTIDTADLHEQINKKKMGEATHG